MIKFRHDFRLEIRASDFPTVFNLKECVVLCIKMQLYILCYYKILYNKSVHRLETARGIVWKKHY